MYIENVREFLLRLNFIEDKTDWEPGEPGGAYYKKINDNLQLFAVSTDENDIMFISEHQVIKCDSKKFFEDDYNNYEILSEYIDLLNLADILYDYDLIEYAEKDLFYVYKQLQEKYLKLKKEKNEDLINELELDEFIGFAETSISLLKDENWLTLEGLNEFLEKCEDVLK